MILCLAGPTAVGKTEFALALAERLGGEIIGADAFQVYAGMDVLTAKPSAAELQRVPHHLIGEISLSHAFDAAQYRQRALAAIAAIEQRGRVPLVVGGSGFYFRALLRGLPEMPAANAQLRAELAQRSLAQLAEEYARLDPAGAAQIDRANPRRLIRALEVSLLSGRPFSSYRAAPDQAVLPARGFALNRDRADLHRRIEARVETMFAQGVIEEVRQLSELGATAAQVLGLREIQAHLRGEITRAEAITAIAQATRHYAKRQLTWFRREPTFEPILLPTPHTDLLPTVERAVRAFLDGRRL